MRLDQAIFIYTMQITCTVYGAKFLAVPVNVINNCKCTIGLKSTGLILSSLVNYDYNIQRVSFSILFDLVSVQNGNS